MADVASGNGHCGFTGSMPCARLSTDQGDGHLVLTKCSKSATEMRGGSFFFPPSWFCDEHAAEWDEEHADAE
jgi:hypothetical protein